MVLEAMQAAAGSESTVWRRSRPAFFKRCLLYAGIGLLLFYLAPSGPVPDALLGLLALAVGEIASAVGVEAVVSGPVVVIPGTFGIEIAMECSGVPELLIFLSAVLAFPASTRSRVIGVAVAVVGVMAGNIVRLAALFLVGVHAPANFDFVHTYVQGPLSYVLMVVLWLGWLKLSALSSRSGEPSTPSP